MNVLGAQQEGAADAGDCTGMAAAREYEVHALRSTLAQRSDDTQDGRAS